MCKGIDTSLPEKSDKWIVPKTDKEGFLINNNRKNNNYSSSNSNSYNLLFIIYQTLDSALYMQ